MSALDNPRMSGVITAFHRDCAARRERVLAHPDIAQMLCKRPYNLINPETWTGYIPPAEVPSISGWKRNESPIRKQLIAICEAVRVRENELKLTTEEPPK